MRRPLNPSTPLGETKAPPVERPLRGGSAVALKMASEINQQRMNLYRMTRPDALLPLNPARLREYHQQRARGYFYYALQLWQQMEDNDLTLQTVIEKRKKDCARLNLTIETDDESSDAQRQKATLEWTYKNIHVTSAYDQNQRGGVKLLVRQMLDCIGKQYSAHELVWSPVSQSLKRGGAMLGLEARFVPGWFFENITGRLRYVPQVGGFYGTELAPGGWLVAATSTPLMQGCAIAYLFKHFALGDWLMYCDRFGMPGVTAKTSSTPGSAEWEANKAAVADLIGGTAALFTSDTQAEIFDFKAAGTLAYPEFISYMDKIIVTAWRGADQSTHSKENATGASLQQNETDIFLEDDAELISEQLQAQVDRVALQWAFGPDVEIKARARLLTPDKRDAGALRSNIELGFELGLELSKSQTRDNLGLEPPADEDDTLVKPAATPDPMEQETGKPLTPAQLAANAANAAHPAAPEASEDFLNACADHAGAALAKDFAGLRARIQKITDAADPAVQANWLARLQDDLPDLLPMLVERGQLPGALADILATSAHNGVVDGAKLRRGPPGAPDQTTAANAVQAGVQAGYATPVPFQEALAAQQAQAPLPNMLSTAELERLGPDILQRARFSAGVYQARILSGLDEILAKRLRGEISDTQAAKELNAIIQSTGYTPKEGEEGSLKDLRTLARRRLMIETNVELLRGRGQWLQGAKPELLNDYPAQQLVRGRQAKNPRPWLAVKWPDAVVAAGSKDAQAAFASTGRMVALKDDPVWLLPLEAGGFNRFGVPWPPFDFNSGMVTLDVARADAIALGLLDPGDPAPEPGELPGLNDDLEMGAGDLTAALRAALEQQFGGRVQFNHDILTYVGKESP